MCNECPFKPNKSCQSNSVSVKPEHVCISICICRFITNTYSTYNISVYVEIYAVLAQFI